MAKRGPKQANSSARSTNGVDSLAEARQAATRLIEAIDTWHAWFHMLRMEKDADPGIALECYDECRAALLALCNYGVSIEPFKSERPTSIAKMLPPLPTWSNGGVDLRFDAKRKEWRKTPRPRWQESPELWDAYDGRDGRFKRSLRLRAAALKVRQMLDGYPGAVFAAPTQPSSPSSESKPSRGANRLKIFPKGTADIDQDLVDFAIMLLARRGGSRSDNEIAREITGETKPPYPLARSNLQRMRNHRKQGLINF